MDVLEILGDTEFVQLGKIVTHWVNNTAGQKNTIEISLSLLVINVNSIDIDKHDCEIGEVEKATNLME